MSDAQIAVLCLAAVLVFWMVGAYNRLVELRNAIGAAWQLVDDALRRRGDAIVPLVAALRGPLSAEHGALDALLAAQAQVRAAADALGAKPVTAPLVGALIAAEAAMASASSRVLALLEQQSELRTEPAVAPHATALREGSARLVFARQLFNEAGQAYDDALHQFPTRLLAGLFGFGDAGRL
jgi:LemA protein